jgi:hypothetical protein
MSALRPSILLIGGSQIFPPSISQLIHPYPTTFSSRYLIAALNHVVDHTLNSVICIYRFDPIAVMANHNSLFSLDDDYSFLVLYCNHSQLLHIPELFDHKGFNFQNRIKIVDGGQILLFVHKNVHRPWKHRIARRRRKLPQRTPCLLPRRLEGLRQSSPARLVGSIKMNISNALMTLMIYLFLVVYQYEAL